jgi:hypothetical protein
VRTLTATRYVTPLREGGSLPAIVEADDEQLYVLKFRGAGQGPKALVAELVAGELLRAIGLPVPELVLVEVDAALGRSEGDPEIQDLLRASVGLNLGMAYLSGALSFDPLLTPPPDPALASVVVWCDAYLTNVDRTARNPNMLLQNGQLWLIDHGAALYIHHTWTNYHTRSRSQFPQIKDHVLLPFASQLSQADADLSARLSPDMLRAVVDYIPAGWLEDDQRVFATPDEHRAAYVAYLSTRLEAPRAFAEEALHAYQSSTASV